MKHLKGILIVTLALFALSLGVYSKSSTPSMESTLHSEPFNNDKKSYVIKFTTFESQGKTVLKPVNMPLEITNNRITVYNTRSGTKYWEVKYLGTEKMSRYHNFEFHKYYLINKRVYFYISVKRIFTGVDNLLYYMIEFDGEVEFAL